MYLKPNREYKDSVFSKYFSEDAHRLIELYNAVSGESYPLDTTVELNTLDGALYKDRINDISFLLGKRLVVLVEHQSTLNMNMPLRMLSYVTRLYEKLVPSDVIYKNNIVKIPTPKFYVLYNGEKPIVPKETLRLSTSFMDKDSEEITLELIVKVHNINYDSGLEVLQDCTGLRDYSYFVHCVREGQKRGLSLEEAIAAAIRQCIQENVMRKFLEQHGSEVENMLYSEWNMDRAIAVGREEAKEEGIEIGEERGIAKGREEGIEIGEERGMLSTLCRLVTAGKLGIEDAANDAALSMSEFLNYMKLFQPDYKA